MRDKERQRKNRIFNERIRNISGMLNDIPHNYMTAELRQFMLALLQAKLQCHS